jgi:electron transport complex protein RnfG
MSFNLKKTENIWILGIFLGIIGLLSALLLAVANNLTKEPIAQAKAKAINASLKQVLPNFDNNPKEKIYKVKSPSGYEITFMAAKENGKLVGIAAQGTTTQGYAGKIEVLCGLTPKGKIITSIILNHNETPGLGANVCNRKFQKTIFNIFKDAPLGLPANKYLDQFNNQQATSKKMWKISKDGGKFDFATGATITSRAITQIIWEIDRTFILNAKKIIANLEK